MIRPFDGKVALVTGAGSGIGLAVARHLAEGGARRLVLVDRDDAALDAAAFDCAVERIAGDVADEALWERAAPALTDLHLAVVNAGVAGASPIAEQDFAEWRRILSTNLDGAFLTLRAAMRAIRDGGSVVAVASAAGVKA